MTIGCRHKFVDSKNCLYCGRAFKEIKAESDAELAKLRAGASADELLRTEGVLPQAPAAEPHDFRLEPTDDSIAALQHAVARSRAAGVAPPFHPSDVLNILAEPLDADSWLAIASLAMQAYEAAKESGG